MTLNLHTPGFLSGLILLAMALCSCGRSAEASERTVRAEARAESAGHPIQIAAAASLAELAQELAQAWEQRSGQEVTVRLAGSSTLARQIRAGVGADLFLSASAQWVDGLDVLERRAWLGNRLAIVTLADEGSATAGELSIQELAAYLEQLDSLVLAEPGVPVGSTARAALSSLGVALPPRVVLGAHARDVLSKVSQGAAQAGIVYLTDAALDDEVDVLAVLPEECHPPIRYEVALLQPSARALFDAFFDGGDAAWIRDLAAGHGFGAVSPGDGESNP